jgi:hypothetical protein
VGGVRRYIGLLCVNEIDFGACPRLPRSVVANLLLQRLHFGTVAMHHTATLKFPSCRRFVTVPKADSSSYSLSDSWESRPLPFTHPYSFDVVGVVRTHVVR